MSTLPEIPEKFLKLLPDGTERAVVEIEGHHIHYLIRGRGTPVFMMHGNPTWSFLYRAIMAALDPEKFQCIVPDMVGLGYSSRPKNGRFHTLENHEYIMGSFIKEMIREDFIFAGQDWGGPIGLLASMQSAYSIKGMVIMNTMLRPPKQGFKPTRFHKFSHTPIMSEWAFRIMGFPQNRLELVQGDKKSISGTVKEAYIHPLRGLRQNAAPLWLARMVPDGHQHPSVPYLKKCEDFCRTYKRPVFLVWGQRDPILGKLASAHQKIMPHAKVELTDGGHFVQEQHPRLIAKCIENTYKE